LVRCTVDHDGTPTPFADLIFVGPVELDLSMDRDVLERCRDQINAALTELDKGAGEDPTDR
jgi:hypothetical protein